MKKLWFVPFILGTAFFWFLVWVNVAHAGAATARHTARSADALERIADAMERQNDLLRWSLCSRGAPYGGHTRLHHIAKERFACKELEQ